MSLTSKCSERRPIAACPRLAAIQRWLMRGRGGHRHWTAKRHGAAALGTAGPLLALVAIVATTAVHGQPTKKLTIERIYASPALAGSLPTSIRWLPDSKGVTYLESVKLGDGPARTHLRQTAVPSGKVTTLCVIDTIGVPEDLRDDATTAFSIAEYYWAPTGDLAAFEFSGDIFTFDRGTGAVLRRTTSDEEEDNIAFSPDARFVAFTRGHDLFAIDVTSGDEMRLTTSGDEDTLNGVLDWVYMEELFTRGNIKGYWWSPDSGAIAYLQIDESPVKEFPIVDFVPQYNGLEIQHYPKAGAPIPVVRVGVYRFDSGETVWMDVDTNDESYIARVHWFGDGNRVALSKINRDQDHLVLYACDATTGVATATLEERKDTWVNVTYMQYFYKTRDSFVWHSERDGNSHLYLYDGAGELRNRITEGPWEVTELGTVDEKRGHVYFTATRQSVLERHIYRAGERGGSIRQLSKRAGTHAAVFSPNARYYIDTFSNATTPNTISVHDATGKELAQVYTPPLDELAEYNLAAPEFFTITSGEGVELNCQMIKPTNFDETSRYPVLVYVYGGPHRQVVRDKWGGDRYLWHAYLASRGYIVFSVDNRGSFGRGPEWEDPILRRMGHYELIDQLSGVDYLRSLPYVDSARIGMWGWSYGGYMTAMAMFKAPGVFRCGASISPVTDWRFYDAIYTERYMKHPDDNAEGYEESAPINFADGLQAPFFLAHGSADDNVHLANSIRLAHELIDAGKQFDFMVYPRKLHGIKGPKPRTHLYRSMTRFFDRYLLMAEDEETPQ